MRKIFIIAHRGFSLISPENTIASFKKAIEAGVDFIETDLRATSDGIIVCMHDPTLDRTTSGAGFVSTHSYREITSLDAGSWFSPQFKGEHVPRLEELLDLAAGKVGLALEIKTPGIEEEVVEDVEKWGIEDEVIILSSHWVVLGKVKSLNPRITTLADLPIPSKESLRAALSHGANIVSIHKAMLERDFVRYAHRRGVLVNVWPVNTEKEVQAALDAEIDFITTDDPLTVSKLVKQRR